MVVGPHLIQQLVHSRDHQLVHQQTHLCLLCRPQVRVQCTSAHLVHQPADTFDISGAWIGDSLYMCQQGTTAPGTLASFCAWCLQGPQASIACAHAAPDRTAGRLHAAVAGGEQRRDVVPSQGPARLSQPNPPAGYQSAGLGSSSGNPDSSGMSRPCKSRSYRTAAPQEASGLLKIAPPGYLRPTAEEF